MVPAGSWHALPPPPVARRHLPPRNHVEAAAQISDVSVHNTRWFHGREVACRWHPHMELDLCDWLKAFILALRSRSVPLSLVVSEPSYCQFLCEHPDILWCDLHWDVIRSIGLEVARVRELPITVSDGPAPIWSGLYV